MKLTEKQYKQFINNRIEAKQSKYHNQKCVYKGIKFDSKKEMAYFIKLELLEQAGEIHDLKRQVDFDLIETFRLNGKTYRKTKYIADFTYLDKDNKYHVVDTKGVRTDVYKLKKKLMAWKYGIEIEEI